MLPLKDHVILPSEIAFAIRGKMKGGEAAETLKKSADNWVDIRLEPAGLIIAEAKMAPGQPGLDRLNLPGGPITLESFLSRLEAVGIVRTKIEAHECMKEGGQRKIAAKTPMAIEVPVNEGKGKPSVKTIANYIDMGALRHSDRGYVLVEGRNHLEGPATALLADPAVGAAFLGGAGSRRATA